MNKKEIFLMNRLVSTSLIFVFFAFCFTSFSQEKDDLYFNKNDRKISKAKSKKLTSAEAILKDYRSQLINSTVNLDENILNKYTNNNRLKVIQKSLKYNRDNLFV